MDMVVYHFRAWLAIQVTSCVDCLHSLHHTQDARARTRHVVHVYLLTASLDNSQELKHSHLQSNLPSKRPRSTPFDTSPTQPQPRGRAGTYSRQKKTQTQKNNPTPALARLHRTARGERGRARVQVSARAKHPRRDSAPLQNPILPSPPGRSRTITHAVHGSNTQIHKYATPKNGLVDAPRNAPSPPSPHAPQPRNICRVKPLSELRRLSEVGMLHL